MDGDATYVQFDGGSEHTILLRSDGKVMAFGSNEDERCRIPDLDGDSTYTQVAAANMELALHASECTRVSFDRILTFGYVLKSMFSAPLS